jgi:hypothetical protein
MIIIIATTACLVAARSEGLTLSACMRLHLIRIAEEVLARRRQIKLPRPERVSTSRFVR